MSHARIEEVSDSDSDPSEGRLSELSDSDFDEREILKARPSQVGKPRAPPPASAAQQQSLLDPTLVPSADGTNFQPTTDDAKYRDFQCLYPVYFDKNRSRAEGRRVGRELAVENPMAREIVNACGRLRLETLFEPTKLHPKDWSNPGRVKNTTSTSSSPPTSKPTQQPQQQQSKSASPGAPPPDPSQTLPRYDGRDGRAAAAGDGGDDECDGCRRGGAEGGKPKKVKRKIIRA
ncbi:hypothetical protein GMDG_05739 [Pseudogymnoascus destructans 20631-21]|uniref:Signal recognition particle subunit n=1 Tax=Pseudogymnoascus destructans (strain ATCC MYA-4855 / 20631-21) TaxID=658429 RepID=L8FPH2_PSED2|nr:hypothetical protein GMDG_05739 [Pseudogymnoascus destructans 20631-21]